MSWFTERRLDFIDWCLAFGDGINRSDLVQMFGISVPQASSDLQAFMSLYPDAMRYDKTAKKYVPVRKKYRQRRENKIGLTWD